MYVPVVSATREAKEEDPLTTSSKPVWVLNRRKTNQDTQYAHMEMSKQKPLCNYHILIKIFKELKKDLLQFFKRFLLQTLFVIRYIGLIKSC
jgi:hypothetical protein